MNNKYLLLLANNLTLKFIIMKKINLFLGVIALMICTNISFGQTQPPNGGFEDWTNTTTATNWTSSVNVLTQIDFLTKSEDFHGGSFAGKIQTQSVFGTYTVPGVCTYGSINVDMGSASAKIVGGIAYTERPSKIKGWYKYSPAGPDSMIVYCILTLKNIGTGLNDTIGAAFFTNSAATSTYQQFVADFEYYSTHNPDTMNVLIMSSGYTGVAGSNVIIDDLMFDYSTSISDNETLDFYAYPNPSNGVFNVNLAKNETTTFKVYNSLGQMVYQNISNDIVNTIDLSQFVKGLYLLEVSNGKTVKTKKLTLK